MGRKGDGWRVAAGLLPLIGCLSVPPENEDATESTSTSSSPTSTSSSPTSGPATFSTSNAVTSSTSTDPGTTDDTTGTSSEPQTSGSSTGPEPLTVCPEFTDEFDDGVEDPRWLQPYPASTTEADGVSRFRITPEINDEFVRMMVAPEAGLIGATMTLELGEVSDLEGMESTLWIQSAGVERVSFRRYARNIGNFLEVFIRQSDGPPFVEFEMPFDDGEHRFLRVEGSAGALSFSVSADGVSFDPVHSTANLFGPAPVEVGFVGNNREPLANEQTLSFESFSITCPES